MIYNLAKSYAEKGDKKNALNKYRHLLSLQPKHPQGNYNLHALLFASGDLKGAQHCLQTVTQSAHPLKPLAHYYLAWLYREAGDTEAAQSHIEAVQQAGEGFAHFVDAWQFINSVSTPQTRYLSNSYDMLDYAVSQISVDGLQLEFGVRFAASTNHIGRQIKGQLFGFDSFEGLPESWSETEAKGAYSTDGTLPPVQKNTTLIDGWFEDTLPPFCAQHTGPVAFINVDCDLYSSTKTLFEHLGERIIPGTVLVFDEYVGTPSWREDEHKAFMELVEARQLSYEFLAFSPFSRQALVRIL